MSTGRDITRIVRSWLRMDEHESADRLLDNVLAVLDTTPQRRSSWPAGRIADMNTYAKLAVTAAAVAVVAVVGINLLSAEGGAGEGGPAVSPSPSLSPPTPSPAVSPRPAPLTGRPVPISGALDAGTYLLSDDAITRQPFTFTVPDGWRREGNFVGKGTGARVTPMPEGVTGVASEAFEGDGVSMAAYNNVLGVFGDSCLWQGTAREVGSVTAMITALAEQTGHDTSGPSAVRLGGYSATRFVFSVPADFDMSSCNPQGIRLWTGGYRLPDGSFRFPIAFGQTITVYVVDLEGQPQLIVAARNEGSSAADVAELEQVIASIRFK